MEEPLFSMDELYEKAKAYTDTTIELTKLRALDKASDLLSSLISRLLVLVLLCMFVFCANVALALWLGSLMGEAWYGFLAVAGFYILAAALIHFFLHQSIKKRIADAFIAGYFN